MASPFQVLKRALYNPTPALNGGLSPIAEPLPPFRVPAATWTGSYVSEATTLALPAVWRCIEIIAGKIASMPLHAFRNGEQIDTPRLLEQPNPQETRFDTIYRLVASLLMRGNAYAALGSWNSLGYPTMMIPLHVDTVGVYRTIDGAIFYWVSSGTQSLQLDPSQIFHSKGVIIPGMLHGLGVIEYQREAIGQGLALQEYGSRFFSESVTSNVAITIPNVLDQENIEKMQQLYVEKHSGRNREPMILNAGATLQTYNISPKDAEFLGAINASANDVAMMFGVPAHYLGVSTKENLTYTNAELEGINLSNNTLDVWCNRLEQTFSTLLPRGTEAKFYRDANLRSDTLSRYSAYASGITAGWLLKNEVRVKENLPEIPGLDVVGDPEPGEALDDLDVNGANSVNADDDADQTTPTTDNDNEVGD